MNDNHLDSAEITVSEAQAMFNRVLSSWASDLLLLRREGLADEAPGAGIQLQRAGVLHARADVHMHL